MKLKTGTEKEYEEYKAKNNDPYGGCVVQYSEDWADLMEKEMSEGKTLEECAESTSHEADKPHGITGFMYGCAVQGLAHFWEHGEALRVWHNKSYGVEETKAKGGVVNPAILTIGDAS